MDFTQKIKALGMWQPLDFAVLRTVDKYFLNDFPWPNYSKYQMFISQMTENIS